MASNFDGLARMIVSNVGGRDNVAGLRPGNGCLIFQLKDDGRANTAVMESIPGVASVRKQPGKYVVNVEGSVAEVYAAVCERGQLEAVVGGAQEKNEGSPAATATRYIVGIVIAFAAVWVLLPAISGGSASANRVFIAVAAAAAASVISAFVSGDIKKLKNPGKENEAIPQKEILSHEIYAPLSGEVVALSDIPDRAFASGDLGEGLGIVPQEGKLYAPCDGEITTFFPTGHAIGIHSKGGADVLIHVGLDTVSLNGDGFRPKKKQGEMCQKGELLLEFNIKKIQKEGFNPVTPILIANSTDFENIQVTDKKSIEMGELTISLMK